LQVDALIDINNSCDLVHKLIAVVLSGAMASALFALK